MIGAFRRLSLATQTACLLLVFAGGIVSAVYLSAVNSGHQRELARARTVADMVDAYRALASRSGGFYIRRDSADDPAAVGRFLASFDVVAPAADGAPRTYTFHQKNTFLALADYSASVRDTAVSAGFRMVSDNYMNPANAPDHYETVALGALRAGTAGEHWAVVGGQLRYSRPLRAEQACMACHGTASAAPAVVQRLYAPPLGTEVGGGYGYRVGDVVGLTSISIVHRSALEVMAEQGTAFWTAWGAVLATLLACYVFVLRGIVLPLRRQAAYVTSLAMSDESRFVEPPQFADESATSANEIHQQAQALKSIHESMNAATALIHDVASP